jgi:hypothetical protein
MLTIRDSQTSSGISAHLGPNPRYFGIDSHWPLQTASSWLTKRLALRTIAIDNRKIYCANLRLAYNAAASHHSFPFSTFSRPNLTPPQYLARLCPTQTHLQPHITKSSAKARSHCRLSQIHLNTSIASNHHTSHHHYAYPVPRRHKCAHCHSQPGPH